MNNASQFQRLAGIVGAANLTLDTSSLRDFGWDGALPKAFVVPSTPEQVCEIVRAAQTEGWRIAPVGGMTKLQIGGVPREIDVAVSLGGLRRVVDYQPGDLTLSVEAGMTIEEIGKLLGASNQMLPLDVPFESRATVGGVVATNSSGPRRLGYGSLRDLVIGIQFVTAEGILAKSGGKVVKNVAGYDVAKLLIGSFGTLAIVTGVTFKVFPLPPASVTIVCGFPSIDETIQARDKLLNSPFSPQALDIVNSAAGDLLGQPFLGTAPYSLIMHSLGPESAIERIRRETLSVIGIGNAGSHLALKGDREAGLWRAIRDTTPAAIARSGETVAMKASLELSKIGAFIDHASRAASAENLHFLTVARAGTGIVYCYLRPEATLAGGAAEKTEQACREFAGEAARLGGSAVVEWCHMALKSKMELWSSPGDDFSLMQKMKVRMDPANLLNPGKLWGRL